MLVYGTRLGSIGITRCNQQDKGKKSKFKNKQARRQLVTVRCEPVTKRSCEIQDSITGWSGYRCPHNRLLLVYLLHRFPQSLSPRQSPFIYTPVFRKFSQLSSKKSITAVRFGLLWILWIHCKFASSMLFQQSISCTYARRVVEFVSERYVNSKMHPCWE